MRRKGSNLTNFKTTIRIGKFPLCEKDAVSPETILGLFDVSVQPSNSREYANFFGNHCKFEVMVQNMDQSFLITKSWKAVQKRIQATKQ